MISFIRLCCFVFFFVLSPLSYADDYNNTPSQLTLEDITDAAKPTSKTQIDIPVTQEVADEINHIRNNETDRKNLLAAIQRLKEELPQIQQYIDEYHIPPELLALPLALSNYTAFGAVRDPGPAGVWKITMKQADDYGLIIDNTRDDRFNIKRSTEMEFVYLTDLYNQFKDWMLVVCAVQLGDKKTRQLIAGVNPHDAWTLARSSTAPPDFMPFLIRFSAYALILRQPGLITDNLAPARVGD